MGSLNAWKLRNRLSEVVRDKKLVNLGEIMRDVGYSNTYSLQPSRVMKNPNFNMKSVIDNLDNEISRIQEELKNKDLSEVQYESLVRAMDIQVKNKQLLSGGATERIFTIEISDAIAKKNDTNTSSNNNS